MAAASLQLSRHPESEGLDQAGLTVAVTRRGGAVELTYQVTGAADLDMASESSPERVDGLWQATCFELFVRAAGEAYDEFNFSPSTRWAAYGFTGYRDGMTDLDIAAPAIERRADGLAARLDLAGLGLPEPWRIGVSAILQTRRGERSYWALAHAPGKPDFHHPDAFALELA